MNADRPEHLTLADQAAKTRTPYGIVGRGKLSTAFFSYLDSLSIPYRVWNKGDSSSLEESLRGCERIWVLIPDREIDLFLKEHSEFFVNRFAVHASGSLVTPLARGMHPLMSFSGQRVSSERWKTIPFVYESEGVPFNKLFPELPNPSYPIDPKFKPRYHALCVLAGNFSVLLWQKLFSEFKTKFDLPESVAQPYLEQIFENLMDDPAHALSGPLKREDEQTLRSNLRALENDPYQAVYQAFVRAYQEVNHGKRA